MGFGRVVYMGRGTDIPHKVSWFTLFYSRNEPNIIKQLYSNKFEKLIVEWAEEIRGYLEKWGWEGNGTPLQYSCLENPWTEAPGRLKSTGSLRVGNDWATSLSLFPFMHWRRKWQPTPVFLPGESQGWGSLVGCHLWGRTELDTTEVT